MVQLANYPGDSLVYHAYMEIWTPVVEEICWSMVWKSMCLPSLVTFSMIIGFFYFICGRWLFLEVNLYCFYSLGLCVGWSSEVVASGRFIMY